MRTRGLLVLFAGFVGIVLVAGGAIVTLSLRVSGSPEATSRDYFDAWDDGDFTAMRRLTADPPADFEQRHTSLDADLRVEVTRVEPGSLRKTGEEASVTFTVTRELASIGSWSHESTLHLAVVDRRWKVVWFPATLHPALTPGGRLRLTEFPPPPAPEPDPPVTFDPGVQGPPEPVDRNGRPLPVGTGAERHIRALAARFPVAAEPAPPLAESSAPPPVRKSAWAIELEVDGRIARRLRLFGEIPLPLPPRPVESPRPQPKPRRAGLRTTLDAGLVRAADRALAGVGRAALVAVQASTGEILAVADTLPQETGAFLGRYPPGSTFKVVTAAALLAGGMGPETPVACPGTVVAGQREFVNPGRFDLGTVPLRRAFAQSCNTTFTRLAVERAGADALLAQARVFGFVDGPVYPGVPAVRADFPAPTGPADLAEASIGQGRVLASPLSMALVAAAVANGTWRPPRLVAAALANRTGQAAAPRALDPAILPGLRSLMSAVVTDANGTAAGAGLPSGVAGKTGTAEFDGSGGRGEHAWFLGYREDLAFAVFVAGGGSGGQVAAPIAARFLAGVR
ncbi:penicillin-binding transpeptidase domain-containing protein [Rhizohabitans arisaemae]|uniref:penicillin-binding transpeptidase domain-containing protein n=1 Tax=Rhizohabitans arisaemae TaxID=2720610 RepID=UPI0024B27FDD|nr:penicillin-binding transpeptidase domain-containing protein [Rhizohabitans arisaemae]